MLINSSPILILFILPEMKDFSNLKPCDIINYGWLREPEISDSVCHFTGSRNPKRVFRYWSWSARKLPI